MPETKKHTYESSTLGVPPLKMVLVHARNDAENTALSPKLAAALASAETAAEAPVDKEKAVRRLIQHLEAID
ncbi:MAG TPA: hypothetical protein VF784_06190 [Anaerolineales bacterium]